MGLFQLENRIDYYFQEISNIPRGSDNERGIRDYIERFVVSHGLSGAFDEENNNFIVYKEASKGYENHEPVMLQGHLDMVCEKNNDSQHDFLKDPIELIEEDGFLHANKTTLGADDGVAICYMLAILEDQTLKHPPLECVFTAQEEVGLKGAMALNKSHIHAKRMIGLDSGDEKVVTISCSGGRRMMVEKELHYIKNNLPCYQITIGGLKGGHSGDLIHLERGNANKLMSRLYYQFLLNDIDFALGSLQGGLKDNAITRSSRAILMLAPGEEEIFMDIIKEQQEIITKEYHKTDANMSIEGFLEVSKEDEASAAGKMPLTEACGNAVIAALRTFPWGIQKMSQDMEGLVQTSLNPGILATKEDEVSLTFSVRSSVASEKEELYERLLCLTQNLGGKVNRSSDYPAWEYVEDSKLRTLMGDTYREMYKKEPVMEVIHAGVECGLFSEKMPGLDCVSYGPDIFDIHTPQERLSISSTKRIYEYTVEVLKRLK